MHPWLQGEMPSKEEVKVLMQARKLIIKEENEKQMMKKRQKKLSALDCSTTASQDSKGVDVPKDMEYLEEIYKIVNTLYCPGKTKKELKNYVSAV